MAQGPQFGAFDPVVVAVGTLSLPAALLAELLRPFVKLRFRGILVVASKICQIVFADVFLAEKFFLRLRAFLENYFLSRAGFPVDRFLRLILLLAKHPSEGNLGTTQAHVLAHDRLVHFVPDIWKTDFVMQIKLGGQFFDFYVLLLIVVDHRKGFAVSHEIGTEKIFIWVGEI